MVSLPVNLLRCVWPRTRSVLEMPRVSLRGTRILLLLGAVVRDTLLSHWQMVALRSIVSLLISCLLVCPSLSRARGPPPQ